MLSALQVTSRSDHASPVGSDLAAGESHKGCLLPQPRPITGIEQD